jgi:hypothetical protein
MPRWTDLATWRGPTTNQGPAMVEHRGVVLHIAAGSYEGTIAWQKNPDADVSSHFVVAKDGRVAQVVDTDVAAWTQILGNGHWLSIENEGFLPDKLTAGQVEAAAQILARAHRDYGVPLQVATSPSGRGLGHHSMGAENGVNWGHSACPGAAIIAQKPLIVARAKEIIEGDDMALTEPQAQQLDAATARDVARVQGTPKYDATWTARTGDTETSWEIQQLAKLDALAKDVAAIKSLLTAGVVVPAQVSLTPESVAAVADATADELHADPERDGV